MMQYQLAAALLGYLLGSIPFGLVLTRLGGLGHIRSIGPGNIGATNVLRTGRKDLAVLTLLLDGRKGKAAALIGPKYGPATMVIAAFAAFPGHLFPVLLTRMHERRDGIAAASTCMTPRPPAP